MDLPETIFGVTRRRFEEIIAVIDDARQNCETSEEFENVIWGHFAAWSTSEVFVAGYALGLEVMQEMQQNPITVVLAHRQAYDGRFVDDNNKSKKQEVPTAR